MRRHLLAFCKVAKYRDNAPLSSLTQPSSFTFATKFKTDFSGLPLRNRLDVLREKIRWSCGAGLVFMLGIARVELNYCVPFRAQNSDRLIWLLLLCRVGRRFF